jgi:hypothetical protein
LFQGQTHRQTDRYDEDAAVKRVKKYSVQSSPPTTPEEVLWPIFMGVALTVSLPVHDVFTVVRINPIHLDWVATLA